MERPEHMTEAEWAEHLAETDPAAWQKWYWSRYHEEAAHRAAQR